jgi:hypothetical protein
LACTFLDRRLTDRVQRLVGALAEVGQLAGGGVDVDLVFGRRFGNARHGPRCHRLARQAPASTASTGGTKRQAEPTCGSLPGVVTAPIMRFYGHVDA